MPSFFFHKISSGLLNSLFTKNCECLTIGFPMSFLPKIVFVQTLMAESVFRVALARASGGNLGGEPATPIYNADAPLSAGGGPCSSAPHSPCLSRKNCETFTPPLVLSYSKTIRSGRRRADCHHQNVRGWGGLISRTGLLRLRNTSENCSPSTTVSASHHPRVRDAMYERSFRFFASSLSKR